MRERERERQSNYYSITFKELYLKSKRSTHRCSLGLNSFGNFVNWTGEHDRELCPSLRGVGGRNHFNVVICILCICTCEWVGVSLSLHSFSSISYMYILLIACLEEEENKRERRSRERKRERGGGRGERGGGGGERRERLIEEGEGRIGKY